jgi:hypothetical protein
MMFFMLGFIIFALVCICVTLGRIAEALEHLGEQQEMDLDLRPFGNGKWQAGRRETK